MTPEEKDSLRQVIKLAKRKCLRAVEAALNETFDEVVKEIEQREAAEFDKHGEL